MLRSSVRLALALAMTVTSSQAGVIAGKDDLPPRSQWRAFASAIQEDIFPAEHAIDGRFDTRWSSPASDPHWLSIDMGATTTVCGVTIFWETAFSSEYIIETSVDGERWNLAYSMSSGDGRSDDVYFRPTPTRFLKITGVRRGTGWGHSIWELEIKGLSEMPDTSASGDGGQHLMDGDRNTVWTAPGKLPQSFVVDLVRTKALGGVRIDWSDNYASKAELLASTDGKNWTRTGSIEDGTGVMDVILHPRTEARFIRVDLLESPDGIRPVQVAGLSLRGPEEIATPLALYEIAAAKTRPGVYPEQLRKRQVYWTILGLPGDRRESLIDEYGNVEPRAGGSSLMPYIFIDGKLHSALDAQLTASLDNGFLPLPRVSWTLPGAKLEVEAQTSGEIGRAITFARYRITNTGRTSRSGRLFLAVRPVQINPPWQFGGLSNIREADCIADEDGTWRVMVNGVSQYISLSRATHFGARPFNQGDIARELVRGVVPPERKASDEDGMVSAALGYSFDLDPGQSKTVIIAMPLNESEDAMATFADSEEADQDKRFDRQREELRDFWTKLLDHVTIEIPDREVLDTMKAQIGYILINMDGHAIQPGSRNYKRCWIRDGALTSAALLRMGLNEQVRQYLDWYAASIYPNGLVPPILNNDGTVHKGFGSDLEWDSQGQYIYAVMEYYRFTGDLNFLKRHFEAIQKCMRFMVTLRERTLQPDHMKDEPARERFVGILPKSISHEGYSPEMHSYWDDFWALKGWKDGREAALLLGESDVAEWAQEQYDLLLASTLDSINRTIEFKGINIIPGCAEKGDFDPTSTTIAFFPCQEAFNLPMDVLRKTYDVYFKDIQQRLDPMWRSGYTPYEIRNISALVQLGMKDRAEFLLDFILKSRRPAGWRHLAEVVLGDERLGAYIGDMPHTWVGSGFINSIRQMLVREQDDRLVLLAGVPVRWLTEDHGIQLASFPTHFGLLEMEARGTAREFIVRLGGAAAEAVSCELVWPFEGKPSGVTLNGAAWTDYDERSCRLPAGAAELVACW